ncbi:hypothetical protein K388_04179 [Streptomyces sp. KhCrAH-43]|uniref:hypothetical protein n=1 Tax=unclassified Streptomyces TaxID=2593676 RepID=UPI00035EFA99|nr:MULTISPECIES: hypothetical protein [unclassified Streptomyces]MYS33089.1 hypothetical protein [Streptomyces sp. SID4920]MYX67712.1 hypothetical protein [Streptomyces sp. SID8373]RAJ58119.1 hypothetical protein K388_04179 [Streptomyces sp. KhCrAH-43]
MSTRAWRRTVRAVLALLLGAAALTANVPSAAAAPQPMGRCTTTSGVVLAVDFSHWGGPVYRSCGTTPTTGYELLNQGGWRTTGTGHDGPAFICRIGYSGHQGGKQYPTPQQEDCVLTPPASAYWSYWHADPGASTWEYSQLGAMLYKPKPGSVDLWIFGGTDIGGTKGRPTLTPDQLRAHNTRAQGDVGKPRSTERAPELPPGTDTGPEAAPTKKPTPSKPASASPRPSHSPSPSPSQSASTSPSPTATPTPSASDTGPRVLDAAPASDAKTDAGSVLPAVAGGALVLLVGGAAVYAARRRRRTE